MPIEKLKHLRVLHLRQVFAYPEYRHSDVTKFFGRLGRPSLTMLQVMQQRQMFANTFFAYLQRHSICPEFTVLILGDREIGDISFKPGLSQENGGPGYIARTYFVKGFQTDIFGQKTAIGLQIPLDLLRSELDVSILDVPQGRWWYR